jgi:YHS domain-containing protein
MNTGNLAIQGYDTVSYFTDAKPVKGSPEFEYEWQGARWRFASAAHRDQFSRQPESFAPRFGGFCAGSIADGMFVPPDPEAWAIVDGKLYLNGSKAGLVDWQRDPLANIAKAQQRWEALGQ